MTAGAKQAKNKKSVDPQALRMKAVDEVAEVVRLAAGDVLLQAAGELPRVFESGDRPFLDQLRRGASDEVIKRLE